MISKIINFVRHFDLVIVLADRELKVKFKGAALGFLWSLLNPLLTMAILTVVFSYVFRLKVENYPLFVLCGLLPWNFFSLALSHSNNSIIVNSSIIKKVPLPREIFPVSIVAANFFNFMVAMVLLLLLLVIFGIKISAVILLLPVIILVQLIFTLGVCVFFSCVTVFFRDINHLISIILMLWFYVTPVFYPVSMVPKKYLGLFLLNPMAVFADGYREVLLYGRIPDLYYFLIATAISFAVFAISYYIFLKYEDVFGELI